MKIKDSVSPEAFQGLVSPKRSPYHSASSMLRASRRTPGAIINMKAGPWGYQGNR
jgi:hypothetical protein